MYLLALALCSCGHVESRGELAEATLVIDNNHDERSEFAFDYELDGRRFAITSGIRIDAQEAVAFENVFSGADRDRITVRAEVVTDGIVRVNEYETTIVDGAALVFAYDFDEQGNFQMRWEWK